LWTASQNSATNSWNRNLNYNNATVNRNNNNKANGFSVRCVRESILTQGMAAQKQAINPCGVLITEVAKNQKLPLYLKLYQFLKFLYEVTRNFPKQYKYTLGKDILNLTWRCLDLVLEANALSREEKHPKILKLSLAFDQLKIRLRMAQEIDLISKRQFSYIQTNYVKEIGEMIGGWSRWAASRPTG